MKMNVCLQSEEGKLAQCSGFPQRCTARCTATFPKRHRTRDGKFADLAAEALREEKEGKTISLHEFLDQRDIS